MNNFNPQQLKAINSNANVTVVMAGAGSGKTTVLTSRIKRLLLANIAPYNILAITFTNKAAQEMKNRIQKEDSNASQKMTIATFHSLAVRIIKENIEYLPHHNRNFLIIDDEDKKSILKKIIKDLNINDDITALSVNYAIGDAKCRALTYKNVESLIPSNLKEIYQKYMEYCQQNNAIDFDDLMLLTYELLKKKEVKEKLNNKYKFIHVDEYQDTSLIQGEILQKLKGSKNNLFIVGDVDQSIYTWRGATIDNIMNITNQYPDTEIIKLEQNYRSTQQILDRANKLISYNKTRVEKNLWTENKKGTPITYKELENIYDEANYVTNDIKSITDYGGYYSDHAVLYRYNYQSRRIEEKLIKNKIPYKIYGGLKFYERMEIKDILAYIRVIINPNDNISLLRIINVPKRKVGEKTLQKLQTYAQEKEISLFQTMQEIGSKALIILSEIILKYQSLVQTKDLKEFKLLYENLITEIEYENYLAKNEDKNKVEDRMQNIHELKEGLIEELKLNNDIIDYINEISLFKETEEEFQDKVILSTIHGVKGLEFDNVYLIGMIEGKFPKNQALENEEEMEEERRLAYVGVTRAKTKLTLLGYKLDYKYELQQPSRFIKEMDLEIEENDDWKGFIF